MPYFARGKFEVAEVMLAMRIAVVRELVEVTNSRKYLGEFFFRPGGHPPGRVLKREDRQLCFIEEHLGDRRDRARNIQGEVVDPLFRDGRPRKAEPA
jgi:hypothetical protein